MSARILLLAKDPDLGAQLQRGLRDAGYTTLWLRDGAPMPAFEESFDLVILDLSPPTSYGLAIVKELRSRSAVPVIVVTPQGQPRRLRLPASVRALMAVQQLVRAFSARA